VKRTSSSSRTAWAAPNGGQHASFLAVATIEDFLVNTLSWLFNLETPEGSLLKEFREALQRADARVCEGAAHHPHLKGMGTTLTLACSVGSDLFAAHVGDSSGCQHWRKPPPRHRRRLDCE
jgi:serine/threonine protein phosphatase PrpC